MEQELQKEPKRSFYALEQLRQTAEAILHGSQRLLKCRAGVEKYRTAQPQHAYAYYLELQKTRDALVGALGDAQRCLLELEAPTLVQKAGQLQAGLRRFDLMSRAYKPVYEVLTGFAKSLPQADTVNVSTIGRLMNHVRMGYYPTDPENIMHILRGIQFPEGVTTNLLDPCCGCGKALRQLADGNNCYTYGMELDEHRAEEAQTRLHRVGFGSFFHSQISREAFHVLFLNPSYLSVMTEGGSRVRSEKQFLVQSIRTLMLGGLLVYKSMPETESERRLLASLLRCDHELHGLPGFYTKDGTWTLAGANGFLIPVRNKDGLIQGMKIRLDDGAARKYRWLSSRSSRMENGTRSYSWIHVTGDTTQKRAYLTEGPLKGDIASYFANNALFVCLGGVNAHKGLRETLLSLGVTEVMEAMDMDQFTNPQVWQAILTLRREVQSIPGIRYYQCTWNPRFKGVDDYLLDWTKRKTA